MKGCNGWIKLLRSTNDSLSVFCENKIEMVTSVTYIIIFHGSSWSVRLLLPPLLILIQLFLYSNCSNSKLKMYPSRDEEKSARSIKIYFIAIAIIIHKNEMKNALYKVGFVELEQPQRCCWGYFNIFLLFIFV